MKVRLVKNRASYGRVHRQDCLSKGYSTNCEPWSDEEYEVSELGYPPNFLDEDQAEELAERADEEDVRFCSRCLPDLAILRVKIVATRGHAFRMGVTR